MNRSPEGLRRERLGVARAQG